MNAPTATDVRASGWAVLGLLVVGAYVVGLCWAMQNASYNVWGALLVAPLLGVVTVPLLTRAVRRESDPRMVWIIWAALGLKLAGALVRYAVAFEVYERADADSYDRVGRVIGAAIRNGVLVPDVDKVGGEGTRFIQSVTGWVYAVTGPSKLAGFLVFSWLGFWGLYLFYRAFRIAVPAGDHRRYALLVFFLPSLMFWPSSIGKEAWMTLTLGITAYGCARFLVRRRGGLWLVGAGMWGTAMVRPHITLVVFVALAAGALFRRAPRRSPIAPAAKMAMLVVMLVIGLVVVSRVESFFGVETLDSQGTERVFDETQRRSTAGNSAFAAPRVRSPLDLPVAATTVLVRPFPYEVRNFQSAVTSLEGMILLVLCLKSARRLASLPRQLGRTPYLAFAAAFTLLFVYAFSSVGNFGIIARQRVQVFPFVIVLLSLPAVASVSRGRRSRAKGVGAAEDRAEAETPRSSSSATRAG